MSKVIEFGTFELHPVQRLLLENGQPVVLGSRAFDILTLLLENAGDILAKDVIFEKVWQDITVEESSLRVHISAVRRALRDGRDNTRFITNVPGRGYSFVGSTRVREEDTVPDVPAVAGPRVDQGLPLALNRVIGRAETILELETLIEARRCLTIAGPGGIGKTTIALAVARSIAGTFTDGIKFIELSSLNERDHVANAIATKLDISVRPSDVLADLAKGLSAKRMLIILDSCENVVEKVAELVDHLLGFTEGVHILVTTREPLRAQSEWVHRLTPLAWPRETKGLTREAALRYSAVELFAERAADRIGGFTVTDDDAPIIGQICQRLDGIALAIELAASRVDLYSLRDLATQLDNRFKLLTVGKRTALPRHQTLRATLDWSYDKLSERERLLLRRLSVFQDVFSLRSVFSVCSNGGFDEADVADLLAELVAKSLVSVELREPDVAYRLLDTTRSYAEEKLMETTEWPDVKSRHTTFIHQTFAAAAKEWHADPSPSWISRYRVFLADLRASLQWAASEQGDSALLVSLTISSLPLWSQLSLVDESIQWVDRATQAASNVSDHDKRALMELLAARGGLQMYALSTTEYARDVWARVLALAEEIDDSDHQFRAVRAFWAEAINSGEYNNSLSAAARFRELAIDLARPQELSMADRLLGWSLYFLGRFNEAERHIRKVLNNYEPANDDLVRFLFDQRISAKIIQNRLLWTTGKFDAAVAAVRETVDQALATDHVMTICNVLTVCACPIAVATGDLEMARRYTDICLHNTNSQALNVWHYYARAFDAEVEIQTGDVEGGARKLRATIDELRKTNFNHSTTTFLGSLSEAYAKLGRWEEALQAIGEALERCERMGEMWCLPEIYRLRAEVLHFSGIDREAASRDYESAHALSINLGAFASEVRVSTNWARMLLEDKETRKAHAILGETLSKAQEGFQFPDLVRAKATLDQIRLTDTSKTAHMSR
ncbi:ATP-binding protein [Rhizobium leguminosarum]|uniref:ATP-binding protein n=1 Tax=Rhizobium leguminosarum TaxID=384 RepID=UPI003F9C3642